jgi:hypothetical protein
VSVVSEAHDHGPQPVPRYPDRLNGRDSVAVRGGLQAVYLASVNTGQVLTKSRGRKGPAASATPRKSWYAGRDRTCDLRIRSRDALTTRTTSSRNLRWDNARHSPCFGPFRWVSAGVPAQFPHSSLQSSRGMCQRVPSAGRCRGARCVEDASDRRSLSSAVAKSGNGLAGTAASARTAVSRCRRIVVGPSPVR